MEKQKRNLSRDMEKQTTKARHKNLVLYFTLGGTKWKKNEKRKNIG